MLIKQFYLGCLAHASYLIADEQSGLAVVVDPQRDVEIYLEEAASRGLRISHVFLTHFHADFLAGHLELQQRAGARIGLGSRAQAEYEFQAFGDGERLALGTVTIEVVHTPGHTPESITLLVWGPGAVSPEGPTAALTGDTLFVGDVGRPDLRAALGWTAEALGELLYDSIHTKLMRLPDATLIYPAHGAGSLCGKQLGRENVTTMGEQRRHNYALQPMSKERFLELVLADQPEAPAYFTYDAVLNTKRRQGLQEAMETHLRPLPAEQFLAACAAGAQALDTRPAGEYSRGHLLGSLHVGMEGQFATWCGTLLDRERPIAIVAHPGAEREAATRLGRIGFDHLAGYLDGGMAALADYPERLETHPRLGPEALRETLAGPTPPLVVDVRNAAERTAGTIAGGVHVPLAQMAARAAEMTPQPVVVFCQGGYRSAIAASLLRAQGWSEVADLEGGYAAWKAADSNSVTVSTELCK